MTTQGKITISPDPPSRGTTVTVTLTGGTPGATTVNFTDGTASHDMPCVVSSEQVGEVQFAIPSTWGSTLTVSAPGYADLNRVVGS